MITSGVRQSHTGALYMEQRTEKGMRIIGIPQPELPPELMALQLTKGANSHRFVWDIATRKFTNSVCGVFGCAVCDQGNLAERIARYRKED